MFFGNNIAIRIFERVSHVCIGNLMLCTEVNLTFFPPIGVILYDKACLVGLYTSVCTFYSLNKVIQTLVLSVDNNIYGTCIRCPWEIERTTQSQSRIKKNIRFFILHHFIPRIHGKQGEVLTFMLIAKLK